MCNKITLVKLNRHDIQGPTHLAQVAPFNLKSLTLLVHALLSSATSNKVFKAQHALRRDNPLIRKSYAPWLFHLLAIFLTVEA